MKILHFDYYMEIDYSVEVSRCNFTIKCIPQNNARQRIEDMSIDIWPNTKYSYNYDGLNNRYIYGKNDKDHRAFYFRISGEAKVGINEYEEHEDDSKTMIFRHPYGMNKAGTAIIGYFKTLELYDLTNSYDKAVYIMHALHRDFNYKPNSTLIDTTAEEAFSSGNGVCQDFAHIFISLLHLAGIPARYVTGLIVGEGASHAWVEILYDGKWYGLDPTNDKAVYDEHIKLGIGRDASDCMINRGIMQGGGLHTQKISVNVTEK